MSDFDLLFQPVPIGPVIAPNRFYQVPHCNGLGYRYPRAHAAMRAVKAEGGWGVVCTEEVEIHHTSDLAPFIEGRLWSDQDIPPLRLLTDSIHQHGALAGIELTHSGHHASNLYSRVTSLGVRAIGISGGDGFLPGQARCMDLEDIRAVRRWHRAAALRARRAGFDIIYCYAAHNLSLAMHFLLRRYNDRSDDYGGNLQNRTRFFRELLEDTKDAVGDTCAVAARLAVDELLGEDGLTHQGDGHEIIAALAELPDLWDVNISAWPNDSATARFSSEGYQEKYIAFVKSLTTKPVVGVGRYTSPESMLSAVQRGILDLIGAARPSIADPFLPNKIKEDRGEDIRECIGCNICVASDMLAIPIRCTQNPTIGEEWRRGWHPETIPARKTPQEILIVGAGPAGLECARALGQRGYTVTILEARRQPGGRVILEAALPGLQEWRRVIDWRLTQIDKMPNVGVYPQSPITAEEVLTTGFTHIIIATGAQWRRDGAGRTILAPLPIPDPSRIFTPDDILAGHLPAGRVLVYDDDHYYMGGLLAEHLSSQSCQVTIATPAPLVSYWTQNTLEQSRIHQHLLRQGVTIYHQHTLSAIHHGSVTLTHTVSGASASFECDAILLVTDRLPQDALYRSLQPALLARKLASLQLIGDAEAPHIIAQAVFSGHLAARQFEADITDETPFSIDTPYPVIS
ncbi:MAG: FAD-dependent oxidoreductase [Anaerolineales bacterium]|nr:FAD-dependent oxidoreductase [Anaerolineales bacterium]